MGAPTPSSEAEVAALRAENARLLRLLELTAEQARRPRPRRRVFSTARSGDRVVVRAGQGAVLPRLVRRPHRVYAIRWENARTGRGWSPAVAEGGGRARTGRDYLPLDGPGGLRRT